MVCALFFFLLGSYAVDAQSTKSSGDNIVAKNEIGISYIDVRTINANLSNTDWLFVSPLNGLYYMRYMKNNLALTSHFEGAISFSLGDCSSCAGLSNGDMFNVNYSFLEYLTFMPFSNKPNVIYPDISAGWLISNERSRFINRDSKSRILKSFAPPPASRITWNTGAVFNLGIVIRPRKSNLRLRFNTSLRVGYNLVNKYTRYNESEPVIQKRRNQSFGDYGHWSLLNFDIGYKF